MSKALWPAVSGAVARGHQVEVIANNLANVNTNGFKKDDVSFKEYLAQSEKLDTAPEEIPRSPIRDRDLYRLDGKDQSFVIVNGTHSIHRTGGLKVTDHPLDVAISGPGFFEVATPQGVRYTRAGSFKMSGDGRLETTEGYPVLSANTGAAAEPPVLTEQGGPAGVLPETTRTLNRAPAADVAGRYINLLGREGSVQITEQGEIYVGEEKVADLSLVDFDHYRSLKKAGSLYFENKDPNQIPQMATRSQLKQGMIETSNVNPVEEISNLIRANRMFEQDLKAMKTVNEMMQREVNDIGKM